MNNMKGVMLDLVVKLTFQILLCILSSLSTS